MIGAGGRNRTDTGWKPRGILSPVRLPVSPLRHKYQYKENCLLCQMKWRSRMVSFEDGVVIGGCEWKLFKSSYPTIPHSLLSLILPLLFDFSQKDS
jgi:hypothetical protein